MENITIIQDMSGNDIVVIDRGNGEYTSMLKSTYDEQQTAKATFASEVVDPALLEKPKK